MRALLHLASALLSLVHPQLPVFQAHAFGPEELNEFKKADDRRLLQVREELAAAIVLERFGCDESLAAPISRYAIENRIPARIVAADVVVESSCRPDVLSSAGAVGLMQVVPSVHHVSRRDLLDPETNIRTGTRILADYSREFGGYREGLRHYLGTGSMGDGNLDGYQYADRVLQVAYRR